ncbi:multidrug effflux MFS transporter [Parapedobacter sp. ISTM3]|uniref:MFS transporter, DHA1 family, bicyclomycin/chloramphenicol resistance protein n=1 Tax=Parapedobacter luteus TaxID=623280 RepID=A0A1T5C8H0_9SPHI|nr:MULTISPECIES: multidrug effflux MFS transporter [Parapedobacter]MBK1439174.1 multidrug effflux MFS transporter [Parapedobacter sp. ISTM3]SKB55420.1 MFS transporter, DHA1 family, bicyclomycin/chloramphenicol resistance protein [Parapedobacter luteus]
MAATTRHRLFTFIILGLLSAVGPFSIDMYLPGFDAIAASLKTTVAHVQLSLTSFFIGIASGQLVYGPLLDRFGRKPPLIVGLVIYIAASIGCALTNSADNLMVYRFIQALGSCGGMVASRAMVRDFFGPSESAKVFSLLMLVIGISPILAPTVGSFVIAHWNWHGIFIVLAVITALILAVVAFFLPESKGPNPTMSLMPRPITQSYWQVFKTRQFFTYAFAGGLASSGLYAYLAGSPYVMVSLYGLNEKQYGLVFAFIASALIVASQLNSVLLNKHSSEKIARIALMAQSSVGLILTILCVTGYINLLVMIGLIFLFLGCQGFVFPNTSALALSPFSRLAGSASALMGSIQMGCGALSSALVSYLHDETTVPMAAVMAGCALLSLIILLASSPAPAGNHPTRNRK